MFLPWFLFGATFVFFVLFVVFSIRIVRRLRHFEELFYDSFEDLQNAANIFDTLVNRRQLLSNDPDVIQIKQVFGVTLDILGEFMKYGQEITERPAEKKEKK